MKQRICSKCKVEKPINEFHQRNSQSNAYRGECKNCRLEKGRERNFLKREEISLRRKERTHGIDPITYTKMLKEQKNSCAICKIPFEDKLLILSDGRRITRYTAAIDHNHETGKIRGLLCNSCNVGLGYFKDNPTYLQRSIIYLDLNNVF